MYAEMEEENSGTTPTPTSNKETSKNTSSGPKVQASAGDVKLYAVLMITSFITFLAAVENCGSATSCNFEFGLMLAIGLLSGLICVAFIVATRRAIKVTPAGLQGLAIFFLVWWVVGTAVGTFYGPFIATGNGYFATWLSLVISLYNAYVTIPKVKSAVDSAKEKRKGVSKDQAVLLVLLVSSLVILIEGVNLCTKHGYCTGTLGWTVSVGTISSVATLVVVLPKVKNLVEPYTFYIACFLAVLWIPGAGIMTFSGPFAHTSNGYFASWAGLFSAVFWAFKQIEATHPEWVQLESQSASPQV